MRKDIIIRIKWETYKDFIKIFPSEKGESLTNYFQRLSEEFKMIINFMERLK